MLSRYPLVSDNNYSTTNRVVAKNITHSTKKTKHSLQFLHGMHVVHRDLKPENILMVSREDFIVKIADFGLATWMHDRSVRMSTLCGTPTYGK